MKTLALFAILTALTFSAATSAQDAPPVKSKAMLKAEADLRTMTAERDKLLSDNIALGTALSTTEAVLQDKIEETSELYTELAFSETISNVLDLELNGKSADEALRLLIAIAKAPNPLPAQPLVYKNELAGIFNEANGTETAFNAKIKKLSDDNQALTEKYNSLLAVAKNNAEQASLLVQQMASQLNYQSQQNAFAQQMRLANALALYNAMPKYAPPQQININISDCTKLPALCVH